MTPENGTFVVDTRHGKVGQVMGHEGPRLQLRPPSGGREWEAAPDSVRPATGAEAFDIAPGTMVVDTVTGGMGRVRTVAPNGMISVEHPNGYTWKTCAVRAANSIERLNLLAADAAQASRPHRQADSPTP
ncbi:hypothetical protein ACH4U6_25505 [Streptomyces netropsis]|uniref:hypothetical protein n=1 Tax=Streptomyces netropsis TaxID=55404 RepID=UPI0037BC6A79